ncbi:MAG TPA: sialate O-acetylesterase [Bacteroidia bacterium]|nr:sialate O-acetylesterase [Bacteroidia bacterium]
MKPQLNQHYHLLVTENKKRLKFLFSFTFLVIINALSYGQVAFTAIPLDSELVARDLKTNLGSIHIQGKVNNLNTPFDSIALRIYRDNTLIRSMYEGLTYTGNMASFDFLCQIPAELNEYKISVYGIKQSVPTPVRSVNALLAGDVYMIEGQSNAFAMMRDGESANENRSEFIRVFGNSDSNTNGLLKNLKWFMAQANGGIKENGHVGQWGLRLGRLLVDNVKIPVAIFNGACGGTPISYYEVPANYRDNYKSNYVREYDRLRLAGLEKNVRAIIWSQGETDALYGTTTAKYITAFESMLKTWSIDYPGPKKIYIFQTRTENMYPIDRLMAIEEAQRKLAVKHDSDIEIIPTSTLKQDKSVLHFDYKGGYEIFGNRIYDLIARDMYGIKPKGEIDAPMITSAYLNDSATLVITERANSIIPHNPKLPVQDYIVENTKGATIDTIITKGNKIIFLLSKYPGKNITASCLSQYKHADNWLTNTSGIEVIPFYKYPVKDSIPKQTLGSRNYSYVKICHKLFQKTPTVFVNTHGKHFLRISESKRKKPQWIVFTGKQCKLDTRSMSKGSYSIRVFDDEMRMLGNTSIMIQ